MKRNRRNYRDLLDMEQSLRMVFDGNLLDDNLEGVLVHVRDNFHLLFRVLVEVIHDDDLYFHHYYRY